jgi:hypothetical protein
MFAGVGVKTVIEDGIGRIERRLPCDRGIADAQLAIITDAQFAANLQGNAGEILMRTHVPSRHFIILARLPARRRLVCTDSSGEAGEVKELAENVYG